MTGACPPAKSSRVAVSPLSLTSRSSVSIGPGPAMTPKGGGLTPSPKVADLADVGSPGPGSIVAPIEVQGFERIFLFFKEQLASGELRPGHRLLPERELAQRLGASRASLREVMRAMMLLGVIEIRPGQGAFVKSPSAGVLSDFFGVLLAMQPSIYDQILEARIAIECQAARLACANAHKSDLDRLADALADIEDTLLDESAGGEADFEFHRALVRASRNEVLCFIHEAIEALLRRSHLERRRAVINQPEFLVTLGDAHRQVIAAILAGDPDQAEAVVRRHFIIAQEHTANLTKVSSLRGSTTPKLQRNRNV